MGLRMSSAMVTHMTSSSLSGASKQAGFVIFHFRLLRDGLSSAWRSDGPSLLNSGIGGHLEMLRLWLVGLEMMDIHVGTGWLRQLR